MKIRVVDFETTGIPTPDDPHAIVEIGWCDVTTDPLSVERSHHSTLVNPGRPIPPEAAAVHHIRGSYIRQAPDAATALATFRADSIHDNVSLLAAHNSRFDQKFYPTPLPWIDTYRCALRVWPDAPRHGNQVLRYWLEFDDLPSFDSTKAEASHRAGPDAYVTAHLLRELLEICSVEQLMSWSNEPALLPRCSFGKHRGSAWSDVPRDYLRWILEKSDIDDEDVIHTARHYLAA